MRYKDLFKVDTRLELNPQCLAWTVNHEHAVFAIDACIHPAAVVVWLGFIDFFPPFPMIYKYQKHWETGEWELIEESIGEIPLVNNNPFSPHGRDAASNTAASVFPQNQFAR